MSKSARDIKDPTAKELLTELARLDSVEVTAVTTGDHSAGYVNDWCEIVLDLESNGNIRRVELTRHDGELIIEALHEVLHPHTNKHSPVQRLWTLLDDVMDFLMADDEPEPEDKARAKALAEAIALISQPYSEEPDIAAVREEAVARWEARD